MSENLKKTLTVSLLGGIAITLQSCGLIFKTNMPGESYTGTLPNLTTIEKKLMDRLTRHVEQLTEVIGERNFWNYKNLENSEKYIAEEFQSLGYSVTTQEYLIREKPFRNIEARLLGTTKPDEILIIGAHYDSVDGSLGANDNGSGVAALLELARVLKTNPPSRSVRFVAFVNEEPPFFQTDEMGSRVYSKKLKEKNEKIVGMISLETMGYYSDEKGSQEYPFPLKYFYPDTGNFIAFVGDHSSRDLVTLSVELFRKHTQFPSEGGIIPGWIPGVGWSDHWSFWQEGYPAIMVTDTAPFRYPHYHTYDDTIGEVDFEKLALVVQGLSKVIFDLANQQE